MRVSYRERIEATIVRAGEVRLKVCKGRHQLEKTAEDDAACETESVYNQSENYSPQTGALSLPNYFKILLLLLLAYQHHFSLLLGTQN